MNIEELGQKAKRRRDILDNGCGLATLDEYNVLTLQLAEAVPGLLRAINDVIGLRDELSRDGSTVSAVARAFADELDRALKGQRNRENS